MYKFGCISVLDIGTFTGSLPFNRWPAIDAKKSSPAPHIAQGPSNVSPARRLLAYWEKDGNMFRAIM
jgi:hypothetical protein